MWITKFVFTHFRVTAKKQHFKVKFRNWAPIAIGHNLKYVQFFSLSIITPPYCRVTDNSLVAWVDFRLYCEFWHAHRLAWISVPDLCKVQKDNFPQKYIMSQEDFSWSPWKIVFSICKMAQMYILSLIELHWINYFIFYVADRSVFRSRWSRNYKSPGTGAENIGIFLITAVSLEDARMKKKKLMSTSTGMVPYCFTVIEQF